MPAPVVIRIAKFLLPYADDLLRVASRTSNPIRLGYFSTARQIRSRDSLYSALHAQYRHRHDWNRTVIPLYSSSVRRIPVVQLAVPGTIRFAWDNPHELYNVLPDVKWHLARPGQYNVQITDPRVAYAGGRKPPWQTPRADRPKSTYGFNRFHSLVTRTYGRYSEFEDFAMAFLNNPGDPYGVATTLALNQAIDLSFGIRARLLKKHVYKKDFYRLPVGIDTLRHGYGMWN